VTAAAARSSDVFTDAKLGTAWWPPVWAAVGAALLAVVEWCGDACGRPDVLRRFVGGPRLGSVSAASAKSSVSLAECMLGTRDGSLNRGSTCWPSAIAVQEKGKGGGERGTSATQAASACYW
jgi:hypothetical protein